MKEDLEADMISDCPLEDEGKRESLTSLLISRGAKELHSLTQIRKEGWGNKHLDNHYEERKQRADTSGPEDDAKWLKMGIMVMKGFDKAAKIVPTSGNFKFLELGCCPGGFATYILRKNASSLGKGVSLPIEEGGNGFALPVEFRPRFELHHMDLTFYDLNPEESSTVIENLPPLPFPSATFNLVILDTHHRRPQQGNPSAHSPHKTTFKWDIDRILISQLIIALQCVKRGGTIFMKLHRPELPDVARVLWLFDSLAGHEMRVIKSQMHAKSNGFYVVAKGIGLKSERDMRRIASLVDSLKRVWVEITIGGAEGTGRRLTEADLDFVIPRTLLEKDYLSRLIRLCSRVWKIQADALEKESAMCAQHEEVESR